ncbi:putative uncharacterized protein [Simkania negevensis Z]|uniref:Swiss Army Knife 2H phosphoesterase domain-containing protein n=2 Tax=Simkania negevensis TaxID=83561 RepID=F8L3N4_SIMNZ|nr:putative uncharacterized protein [Simkania negevensis Z]
MGSYLLAILLGSFLMINSKINSREIVFCPEFLEEIKCHFPLSGTLKQEPDGFTYVDLDDRYIHELIQHLPCEGFSKPPYFGPGLIGAHITVIMPEEWTTFQKIEECGTEVSFSLKECEVVHPAREDISEIFLITIEAPFLGNLRAKYGLPPPLFDFHISLGYKPGV